MSDVKILVVEDEGIVAMDIRDRLAAMGYQSAGHAESGEEALALAEEKRPDLVLMDIRLQGAMDGITAAEEIRRRFHQPVIFVTAYSEDATVERAKLAEPYGYILKPFDDRELKSTIEIALYKHRAEEEIRRLNRLYDVLSQINQSVVRIRSREELLPTVCRLVVERGAVDLAWIGWLDAASSRILPVAHFGNRNEILREADFYANGRPEGHGTHGKAVREGKPFVCNECVSEVCLYPSAQAPVRFGFQSCGSFPLRFQGRVCGVLNLCVSEPGFFREREIELLKEVALDVSFALDKIEAEAQRNKVNRALRVLSDSNQALIRAVNENDLKRQICRILVEVGGFCRAWVSDGEEAAAKSEETAGHTPASTIAFPLSSDSRVFGTLNIHTSDPGVFDPEEKKLLAELADDLAYGISSLRTRAERERAVEALKESEARYRRLVEQLPAITYVAALDEHSTTTFISPQVETLLGYSQDEYGRDPDLWLARLHPEDRDQVLKNVAISHAGGGPFAMEYRMLHRNGSVRWFHDEAVIVRDDSGKPLCLQGIMLDLTERKRAEEKLREREFYYRTLLSNLQEDILVIDSGYRIIDASKDFLPILGRSRENVLENKCHEILHGHQEPCNSRSAKCMLREVLATGEPRSVRHEHVKADGSKVWVDVLLSPLKDHLENVTHVIQTLRDVTREIEMERQLRQAQKMEALGTMAGGIAHDFNNILGIILGYTELAWSGNLGDGPSRESLREVLKATHRAGDLVQQILSYSRQKDQERKPMQLGPLVKEALKLLRASLPSTVDIRQNNRTKHGGGGVVMADPTQIHQVLMNLCNNAEHAMREKGGVLEVSLSDLDADAKDVASIPNLHPGPYVKLTVCDTGHGIDPGILDRIFDPYFTTKRPGEGTGLGLAVVHGIVESHGGSVTVESELGTGSAFHVFLPAIEIEPGVAEERILPAPKGNETILLVDDEAGLVNIGRQMLERLGYKVVTAANGIEALEAFRTAGERFDLVITDQTMPHMKGSELAGEILRINPHIPIILCTGFDRVITPAKAADMGVRALLMKPLGLHDTARAIRRVLDGEGEAS